MSHDGNSRPSAYYSILQNLDPSLLFETTLLSHKLHLCPYVIMSTVSTDLKKTNSDLACAAFADCGQRPEISLHSAVR